MEDSSPRFVPWPCCGCDVGGVQPVSGEPLGAWDKCVLLPAKQLHVPMCLSRRGLTDRGFSGCAGWCAPAVERVRRREKNSNGWRQRVCAARGGCAVLHSAGFFVWTLLGVC
ncbi:chitin-binding like protein, putative [Trypanosoma cruzi]|uniref:Chitin-binding like protein, putative n=1 Tax=Trypanosoma cruzi (strain CL Brener) TaxID=353153 RepID=Q4DLA6_TRYCC|nr:chitin-binding like protein, putative [Trypanosoma cruzi]EAN93309.1 chitin-binding like protein, putative [Trypanosoma cruzi]|eukprot:XP_815160.1 chitin-binding like protein [Trypanosoma cruzi strain CL Brener]